MDDNSNNDKVVSSSSPGNNEIGQLDDHNVIKFVQNLMEQMHSRFQTVSDMILERIDEMSGRIDNLEQSLNQLTENIELGSKNQNGGYNSSKDQCD